jgi:hypothetical protein
MPVDQRGTTANTRVYVEEGKKSTFVVALDWPGWSRRGADEQTAVEALLAYADRYARVAGAEFDVGHIEVVGRVTGTMTTDFGAPNVHGEWDNEPLRGDQLERFADVWSASWSYFDNVVATSSPVLAKGPRGGGRDRDEVRDHVREAERRMAAKLGCRVAPRTPWPEQRVVILGAFSGGSPGAIWPPRYAARWGVWHILDHAWEIEDKRS